MEKELSKIKIAFVIPVFNEGDNIRMLFELFKPLWEKFSSHIIFVDDGSSDNTLEIINILKRENEIIKCAELSRNFGKEQAIAAGLSLVPPDHFTVVMDGDGQHTSTAVSKLIDVIIQNDDVDIVFGVRRHRLYQGKLSKASSLAFYKLINIGQRFEVDSRVGDLFVAKPKVVEVLKTFTGHRLFWKGNYAFIGFNKLFVPVEIATRTLGMGKFNFFQKLGLAIDGFINISKIPLRLVMATGVFLFIISIGFLTITFLSYLIWGKVTPGYYTLSALQVLFGGIIMLSLGLIAEYITLISDQVSHRPGFIIRNYDE